MSDARKPSHHQKMTIYSAVSPFFKVLFLQLFNAVKAVQLHFLYETQIQALLFG